MNQKKIPITQIREQIFCILFEKEISNSDAFLRAEEYILENEERLNKSKIAFLREYIQNYIENENKITEMVILELKGWTFERLGIVEKVLLKMAFYEIDIKKTPFEIVINETLQLSKIYGDSNTKKFINGILACFVNKD